MSLEKRGNSPSIYVETAERFAPIEHYFYKTYDQNIRITNRTGLKFCYEIKDIKVLVSTSYLYSAICMLVELDQELIRCFVKLENTRLSDISYVPVMMKNMISKTMKELMGTKLVFLLV